MARKRFPNPVGAGWLWILPIGAIGAGWYLMHRRDKKLREKAPKHPPKPGSPIPSEPTQPSQDVSSLGMWSFENLQAIPDPTIFVLGRHQVFRINCESIVSAWEFNPPLLAYEDGVVRVRPDAEWNSKSFSKMKLLCGLGEKTLWVMGA